jgi:threonylcarbamoyladenosine tRNA methylthiotransferase MtaB
LSDAAPRRPKLAVVALGCRVSRADADALAADLAPGLDLVEGGERADVVVVSTCCITGDAESAARRALRRAARAHPGAAIVAAGCYAEVAGPALAALPGVTAVIGARAQGAVLDAVERLAALAPTGAAPAPAWGRGGAAPARHTRPFLKVQDGCDQRCSFCIVPAARGPSRSLPPAEALGRLAALGRRHAEVVLTGVHLGAYGRDLAPAATLSDLVREAARRGLVRRLRLSSVEPNELPRDLLQDGDAAAILCEHLHLPLQSGSDRILAAMARPHSAGDFRRAVLETAALLPGACLGTDVLAGFPGEDEADHAETLALLEALPLAYLHVFPFSPRPGTPAASLPDPVTPAVVRERARALRALSERKWRGHLEAQVGRVEEVVVERVERGVARGTARRYATVRWPAAGERRGDVARVRIDAHDGVDCAGVRVAARRDAPRGA